MSLASGLLFLAGFLVSALGTFIGFGGGFLMIPILTQAFGLPAQVAVAGCLAAIFPSRSLASVVNFRRGLIDLRIVLAVLAPAVLAAVGGSWLSGQLPDRELKLLFGAFMTLLGLSLGYESLVPPDESDEAAWIRGLRTLPPVIERRFGEETLRVSLGAAALLGTLGGLTSGLLGIGGGVVYSPALMRVFRLPPRVAAATSLALVAITSLVGAVAHLRLGHLEPQIAAILMAGFLLGAGIASAFDRKVSDTSRRKLVAFGTLGAGLSMLLIRR